jgi:hypothetical protein
MYIWTATCCVGGGWTIMEIESEDMRNDLSGIG